MRDNEQANEQANEQDEQRALYMENLRTVLQSPSGYAVLRAMFEQTQVFTPCADPQDYDLRLFFDSFFRDVEQADPKAAIRLFADIRGIPVHQ